MLLKRVFDICISFILILLLSPFLVIIICLIKSTSIGPSFFIQNRVGMHGKLFKIIKFRSMYVGKNNHESSNITILGDSRITSIGRIIRKYKIDELPSLLNVLLGSMSFVGPRPDVPGYADQLKGTDRKILSIRPGITGPATLKYANEESLLSDIDDPEKFNDKVIYPDKVKINIQYIEKWTFFTDLKIIFKTIFRRDYKNRK